MNPLNPPFRSMATTLRVAVVVGALVATLSGCESGSGSGSGETAGSAVASDERLFARVRDLPHVTEARLAFRDDLTDGRTYTGSLQSDGAVNPYETLDAAVAILRQGRPGADIVITIDVPTSSGPALQLTSTTLLDRGQQDPLTARYGPQPGDGLPPADQPVPTPSGWSPEPSP